MELTITCNIHLLFHSFEFTVKASTIIKISLERITGLKSSATKSHSLLGTDAASMKLEVLVCFMLMWSLANRGEDVKCF